MATPILPTLRPDPICPHCEILMVETRTQRDRLYACRRCGYTRYAEAFERGIEAQALAAAEGLTFDAAWDLVEPLEVYAALWDARVAIARTRSAAA